MLEMDRRSTRMLFCSLFCCCFVSLRKGRNHCMFYGQSILCERDELKELHFWLILMLLLCKHPNVIFPSRTAQAAPDKWHLSVPLEHLLTRSSFTNQNCIISWLFDVTAWRNVAKLPKRGRTPGPSRLPRALHSRLFETEAVKISQHKLNVTMHKTKCESSLLGHSVKQLSRLCKITNASFKTWPAALLWNTASDLFHPWWLAEIGLLVVLAYGAGCWSCETALLTFWKWIKPPALRLSAFFNPSSVQQLCRVSAETLLHLMMALIGPVPHHDHPRGWGDGSIWRFVSDLHETNPSNIIDDHMMTSSDIRQTDLPTNWIFVFRRS